VKAQYQAQNQALLEINAQENRIYEEKLADARKRVEKMNELFADWYFIIPEDVYQQIHLTYANVFISAEEAEKRKREAEEQAAKEAYSASECTDPNCPDHHGKTEAPVSEAHSASECTDPNCPDHHGKTETPETVKETDESGEHQEAGKTESGENQKTAKTEGTAGSGT